MSCNNYQVELKIEGEEKAIKRILKLIDLLRYNGAIGHSSVFYIYWDGDGSDQIKIESSEEIKKIECGGFGELPYKARNILYQLNTPQPKQ